MSRVVVVLSFVAAFGLRGVAFAQTAAGTIAGVVKDESGGAVPGVSVKVVHEGAGAAFDAFTGEQGTYDVAELIPGAYRVEAALDGFETVVRRVVLEAGQAATVDVTLAPARFTEGVVVTARRV